ncbi:hypothetical protein N8I74_04015 [Chitiniphilus purpureus]|uniref:Uncharacterized protein n=1 Tax=Chitiniphilus purpureus TaxID=2981137 RepID=A0ABY6DP83_9NEIS|nr:hypothetical protein [Chitiniphilus sp. CD1]UXY16195.1 hypothetical protein N8I74_04015 [Chitiniphilus sp. CD1]
MASADYHVFGLGSSPDDLHYIGWTQRRLGDEQEQIFSDVAQDGEIAHWLEAARRAGPVSLFEIESARSVEDARDSALFWRQYYHSLGLDVVAARC